MRLRDLLSLSDFTSERDLPHIDYLQLLPVELWAQILGLCWNTPQDRRSLKSLPVVCQLFRDILDPLRYSSLTLRHRGAPSVRVLVLQVSRRGLFAHVRSLTFEGPETQNSLLQSPQSAAPTLPTQFFFDLLDLGTTQRVCTLPNLSTLHLSFCVVNVALVESMQSLPSLTTVHLTSVVLNGLASSLEPAKFRLEELRLSQVQSSDDDLMTLAIAVSGTHLRSLHLTDQSIPLGLLSVISSAISPASLHQLVIDDSNIEREADLIELLGANSGIHRLSYHGPFPFVSLPTSSLPNLERCSISGTDMTPLVRGRPVVDATMDLTESTSSPQTAKLSALAQSTKRLRRLKLWVVALQSSLLDAIIGNLGSLEELDIGSVQGVQRGFFAVLLLKLGGLQSLKTLSFTAASPGTIIPPRMEFFYEPEGRLELLLQHECVRSLGERCSNLRVVNMRPVSWVWLSKGEWQPYPESEEAWDKPLQFPLPQ